MIYVVLTEITNRSSVVIIEPKRKQKVLQNKSLMRAIKSSKGYTKFILGFLFLWSFSTYGNNIDSCFYVQVDLANRWVWRGVSYSETTVIQPSLNFEKGKMRFQIWGSYPFERRAYSEIDFTFEYKPINFLKLGITDYFAINDSLGASHNFFDFNRTTSMHMFDLFATIYPFQNIPVSLLGSWWFWGADRDPVTLEQNFSTYLEIKYEKNLGNIKCYTFLGATPWKGFYANNPAIVNLGIGLSKEFFSESKFSIPAKVEFILNPELENIYINAIITLK